MDRKKVLISIFDYVVITIGTVLFVMAWTSFLLPNNMIDGGLTGASALLAMVTHIPVDIWYFGINVLLLILAWFILGQGFGIKTIYAIVLSTLLFRFLGDESMRCLWSVEGELFYVGDGLLVPIIGGLLEAIGLSMIIIRGGSTGGTDILALIVNKFWPITIGRFYLMADFVVITLLMFVPGHNFTNVVYGYVTMGVCAYVLDLIMLGKDSTVQVLIFSDKIHQIGNFITRDLGRGVTALKAVGWYTQEDRQVLMVMLRKNELPDLVKAVKEVDARAFVTVVPANNVYGEGFDEIKTGLNRKKKK
ncbi:MAG: YitT family protein [Bacteroidales bacterium]|nr:YitT family protein [Bacteroidales bacterium]